MKLDISQKYALIMGAIFIVVVLLAFIFTSGCIENEPGTRATMLDTQKTPTIEQSNERTIFMGYLAQTSNPNNIQWVYCISDTGNVLFRSAVKGKVISATKSSEPYSRLSVADCYASGTYESEIVAARGFAGYIPGTTQLMNPSGMFGHDMEGCVWMNPEGQYFEWHGKYFVSDAPMKLQDPVLTTSNIDLDELNKYKPPAKATA